MMNTQSLRTNLKKYCYPIRRNCVDAKRRQTRTDIFKSSLKGSKPRVLSSAAFGLIYVCSVAPAAAQEQEQYECDEVCQATRESQDPTAAVNGVFLSNSIGFGPSSDDTLYNFQVQPIATIAQQDWGNVLLRGVIPILGVPVPDGTSMGQETEWGISDTILQAFVIPSNQNGPLTFAVGPQISLDTHTDDSAQGAGWGGGIVTAVFGASGPLTYGALVNHLWGEDDYNTSTVQPIVFYNLNSPGIGDWFFGYNNSITYDWSADENAWEVPVGLSAGKTLILKSQKALSYRLGAYSLVETATGGNDWEFTFSASLLY
ncbi:MAG: hypothetical protein AAF719_04750 [Pseudomonadota bacterium]